MLLKQLGIEETCFLGQCRIDAGASVSFRQDEPIPFRSLGVRGINRQDGAI